MKRLLTAAFASAMLLTGAFTTSASAVTVGNAATDRALADGFSNFAIAFTNQVFPTGTITAWETFIESIDNQASTGSMGLLVLEDQGSNIFKVKGADFRTVSLGLNSFSPTSISVNAGEILAIGMGDAKVSYDLINQPSGPDPFTANGALVGAPSIGDFLSLTLGSTDRTYSINATVSAVPLPAALPLFVTALAGLGFMSRRRKAA